MGRAVIPTGASRSEAEWRDLLCCCIDKKRSLGFARDEDGDATIIYNCGYVVKLHDLIYDAAVDAHRRARRPGRGLAAEIDAQRRDLVG